MVSKMELHGDTLKIGNVTYCWNSDIKGYTWCSTKSDEAAASIGRS